MANKKPIQQSPHRHHRLHRDDRRFRYCLRLPDPLRLRLPLDRVAHHRLHGRIEPERAAHDPHPPSIPPAYGGEERGERSTCRKGLAPYLLKLELAILLYWALLPIALSTLHARISHPLANRMWLKGRKDLRGTAGVLYACDLVGAFLGSIVVSVILIPVLGILETCLLAATLKLGNLLLVAAHPCEGYE
jgi:hypothetical protein